MATTKRAKKPGYKKIVLEGVEYVMVPAAEFKGAIVGVNAIDHANSTIGASLRKARDEAGFTQHELAAKVKKSQTFVSATESGKEPASAAYITAVLKACGLPEDWKPTTRVKKARRREGARAQ
jgi:DNA-binding XRE family transcriptional regulator